MQKKQEEDKSIEASLKSIETNLKKLNKNFSSIQIIKRGLINGIASGIGATIGLTLLLFLLSKALSALGYVPEIDQFLQITKLNSVIEKQITTDNDTNK